MIRALLSSLEAALRTRGERSAGVSVDLFTEALLRRLVELSAGTVDGAVVSLEEARTLRAGILAFVREQAIPDYVATDPRAGLRLLDRLARLQIFELEDTRPSLDEGAAAMPSADASSPSASPGARALDAALTARYEDHSRFVMHTNGGESDLPPIKEVAVFRATHPVPHFVYVTYGLSELDVKLSPDLERSGFGVEYVVRFGSAQAEPPPFPALFLRWVTSLVWKNQRPFEPAQTLRLPVGMLDSDSPGACDLAFVRDPELGDLETPHGRVTFVEVVSLARGERELIASWDFDEVARAIATQEGDLVWRVGRPSLLEGPAAATLLERARAEGSSQDVLFASVHWKRGWLSHQIVLDETSRDAAVQLLRYRLAYGRAGSVVDDLRQLTFMPGDRWRTTCDDAVCTVVVPKGEAVALADALMAAAEGATLRRAGKTRFRILPAPVATPADSDEPEDVDAQA